MTDEQKQALIDAYETLASNINAVVGCAMLAPDHMRRRDLPGLVDDLRAAEDAIERFLTDDLALYGGDHD